MVTLSEIIVVACDTLARMANEVEVCIEITRCDSCICEVAVLSLGKEWIVLIAALSAVSACIRVTDEFDVSFLASVCLKDLAFAYE